jgi:hypothetical protein
VPRALSPALAWWWKTTEPDTSSTGKQLQTIDLLFGNTTATFKVMKRSIQILLVVGALAAPVFAQNYPPPPPQYPQQPQQQPQQQPYPQQPQQQQPYYGQDQQYPPPPQYAPQQPPQFAPQQLDGLVGRIALYPDPLLAQILTASTFSNQITDAAGWSRAHSYLPPDQMARAIKEDQLPWDPSVIGLLPFPQVLDMMSGDMGWTQQLGNAVLANRAAVMDAIQHQRSISMNYGYLRSNPQERVVASGPGDIEILPTDPGYIYVPSYDPYIVYGRPRPGFFIGGAITFGPRIGIGLFAPWGWGGISFGWRNHAIIVNNRPWERNWGNRASYVHPYIAPRYNGNGHYVEHHEMHDYPERHGRGH